jgi:hypothetical protein
LADFFQPGCLTIGARLAETATVLNAARPAVGIITIGNETSQLAAVSTRNTVS